MVYSYVVGSQKPTAISHSLLCNFTSSTDCNLILARGNHLEIHTLKETELIGVLDAPLFGNVLSISVFRHSSLNVDVLFVLTDKRHFCVLGYDADNRKIVTRAVGNVKDRVGKELECGQRGFIDPDNRMIGMLLYEGLLKVVPIENNGMRESFNLSLEESMVLDITFLYGSPRPTLCMLYQDNRKVRHVKTLCIDVKDKELVAGPWNQNNVEYSASMIIAVSTPLGGVLIVGCMSITYISGTGINRSVEIPLTQITAYSRIDANGTRYLLGDSRGSLMVLVLNVDRSMKVTSLVTDCIGTTSIAKTLNYLDNGVVFVGSAFGDSQLIKLHEHSKSDTNFVNNIDPLAVISTSAFDVLDVYPNIGPIVDMCLVDNDKQGGQRQLVTCSGGFKDGSLRIVRSGIGIQEQASLEVPGIKGMWSLKPSDQSPFDKFLVQSFIGETRILAIEEEELAEFEIEGFNAELPTLYCGNMIGSTLVQVTTNSVRLVDCVSFQLLFEYASEKTISVASGNTVQVAIAVTGGELLLLEIDQRSLKLVATTTLDQDIACISLRPFASLSHHKADEMDVDTESSDYDVSNNLKALKSSIIALGMWTDNSVRLLALPNLEEVCRVQLGTETQARDILMVELSGRMFIMVGLGDGHLITYNLDIKKSGELPTLINKRKGVLGTHSISFDCFTNKGETCVFASCDRPTVIYSRNGKLLFSVINVAANAEITRMTPFHSQLFPNCLAMSSESSLMIGVIEDIQKVHIQSVPLGEAPRRVAYNASAGAYGVCTEKTTVTEKGEETVSRILFLDAGTLETIGTFELDRLESVLSIICGSFHGNDAEMESNSSSKLQSVSGSVEYFIVGTARVIPEELEPSKGRILAFEITSDRKICLSNEREIPGAAFSLAMLEGKLAAGVSSKVMLFDWLTRDGRSVTNDIISQPELQLVATRQGFIMSLYLKSYGDKLLVGDMVRSMSLLQLAKEGKSLEEVARDFNTAHLLAVEVLPGGDHFIGCDDFGNLMVVRQQSEALSDEERSKLDLFGEFNLGDFVNTFCKGTLVGQPIESDNAQSNSMDVESVKKTSSSATSSFSVQSNILNVNYQSVTGYSIQSTDYSILYGTIGGSIGSVIALREDSYHFFNSLEKAMIRIMTPIGGLTHSEWRNCCNSVRSSPQKHMVDGSVVEMFLDLSSEEQDSVTRFLNEDLNNYIASLQSTPGEKNVKVDSSAKISVLLQNLANEKVELTVEDVVRRVEDISRLH